MGEVYRATDTKLGRSVAVKVLPEAVARDSERLARFDREARTLALLNHPNIAAVYGLEDVGGSKALVMELVEGPTLADRIAHGPIPVEEALPIARQVSEALEAAHEQGIVHRDLKPANVKLRPDGAVKVLDFGLAKAMDPVTAPEAGQSMSPTITTPAMTQAGVVLGTAAYMAPEQARGRPVDRRADVWAFGCVLFEMLSGVRAFGGNEVVETLALVLTKDPDWDALPPDVPAALRRLIRRCLVRDPRTRVRDIGDARIEIEELVSGTAGTLGAPPGPGRPAPAWSHRQALWIGTGGALLLAAGIAIGALVTRRAVPETTPDIRRFEITSRQFELRENPGRQGMDVAVTPDGRQVVFTGQAEGSPQLHVRAIDRLEPRTLAGLGNPENPFVSPDGEWIGFRDGTVLKKINVDGGPAATIASIGATSLEGASWGSDDHIVFATNASTGLLRVPAGGGEPEVLTSPDLAAGEAAHRYPELLPDGRTVIFTVIDRSGAIDNAQTVALDLETGARAVLLRGAGQTRYVAPGYLLYGVSGALWAVPFDDTTLTVGGDPIRVVDRVVTTELGGANFAVARDGTLVYVSGSAVADRFQLVWVDRDGREEPILGAGVRAFRHVRISPDGTRVAMDIREQQNDIWLWDIAAETPTRLTVDPLLDRQPIWSPDGRDLVFTSDRTGEVNLFRIPADGTGEARPLTEGPGAPYATSFSGDGSQLLFWRSDADTGMDLWRLALDGEVRASEVLAAEFDERNGELSPDARWIAYQSNESGRYEVYVRPFPELDAGLVQVSSEGGTRPFWGPDGQELFFWVEPDLLMVMPVGPVGRGAVFPRGTPRVLLKGDYLQPLNSRTLDVTPDGQRFLLIKAADSGPASRPIVVLVQNFLEDLRRLAPPR